MFKQRARCTGFDRKKWKADFSAWDRQTRLPDQPVTDSDEDLTSQRPAKKRKLTTSEEKASRVNELKTQLRQNHSSKYSGLQYALWAKMIVGGTYESMEEPSPVPMFGPHVLVGDQALAIWQMLLLMQLTKSLAHPYQLL